MDHEGSGRGRGRRGRRTGRVPICNRRRAAGGGMLPSKKHSRCRLDSKCACLFRLLFPQGTSCLASFQCGWTVSMTPTISLARPWRVLSHDRLLGDSTTASKRKTLFVGQPEIANVRAGRAGQGGPGRVSSQALAGEKSGGGAVVDGAVCGTWYLSHRPPTRGHWRGGWLGATLMAHEWADRNLRNTQGESWPRTAPDSQENNLHQEETCLEEHLGTRSHHPK